MRWAFACVADVFLDYRRHLPELSFYAGLWLSGPHENFHAVVGQDRCAVVDPAFHVPELFEAVTESGRRIDTALVTHGHRDHVGGLEEAVGLGVERVVVHRLGAGLKEVKVARAAGAQIILAEDGQVVDVGVKAKVFHTPGHQPEGACYLVGTGDGKHLLLGGDTLFVGSCGRTDFPGGDTDAMFGSMARLARLASPDIHLVPGHHYHDHPVRTMDLEARLNPALATTDRTAFGRLACLRG